MLEGDCFPSSRRRFGCTALLEPRHTSGIPRLCDTQFARNAARPDGQPFFYRLIILVVLKEKNGYLRDQ